RAKAGKARPRNHRGRSGRADGPGRNPSRPDGRGRRPRRRSPGPARGSEPTAEGKVPMKLSLACNYAILAVAHLAAQKGTAPVVSHAIAEAEGCHEKYLLKV